MLEFYKFACKLLFIFAKTTKPIESLKNWVKYENESITNVDVAPGRAIAGKGTRVGRHRGRTDL